MKMQVHNLHDPRVKNNLQVMCEETLHCVTVAEPQEQWKQTKTILQETTAEVVGLSTGKHQDWFYEPEKGNPRAARKETLLSQSSACKT